MAPSAFKAMLTAEQPVKAERGSGSSVYEVAWQACKPIEGQFASSTAKNTASALFWTTAGAPDKHKAILRVPKSLSGAAACVSVTMRQAQALQAIMQQAGKHQQDGTAVRVLSQDCSSAYNYQSTMSTCVSYSLQPPTSRYSRGKRTSRSVWHVVSVHLRVSLLDAGGAVELVTHSNNGMTCCPAAQSSVDTSGSTSAMLRVAVTESPSWTCSVITHSLHSRSGLRSTSLPANISSSTHGNTLQVSFQSLLQAQSLLHYK